MPPPRRTTTRIFPKKRNRFSFTHSQFQTFRTSQRVLVEFKYPLIEEKQLLINASDDSE